jgi:beta-glucosidase
MIQGLLARGIEPMVTLHHFTNPLWLAEQGGWENEDSIAWFEAYVRKVMGALGDLVDLWCTINEPAVMIGQAYLLGRWPPGKRSLSAAIRASVNLMCAHAAAYHTIHEINPRAQVGLAKHMIVWRPRQVWQPVDYAITRIVSQAFNHILLGVASKGVLRIPGRRPLRIAGAARTLDWLGVNYYQRYRVGLKVLRASASDVLTLVTKPGKEKGPTGWGEIHPRGLFQTLRTARRYRVPLFITENGIPDEHDQNRPRFILTHLHQLWQAIQREIPVQGYYFWSLVDNFEWTEGYDPRFRFGLLGVDFQTQERFLRTSGRLYEEICRLGGISHDLVERYAPEVLPALFPKRNPAM